MQVKIKLNERNIIKIPELYKEASIRYLNEIDAISIEREDDSIIIEIKDKDVDLNDKVLKYEIVDLDDNFIDDGELNFSILNDFAKNYDEKLDKEEKIIDDSEKIEDSDMKTLSFPQKLEIKKGDIESVILKGINKNSKIMWVSDDIPDFENTVKIKEDGKLILIETKNLSIGIYNLEFRINNKDVYNIFIRVFEDNNQKSGESTKKTAPIKKKLSKKDNLDINIKVRDNGDEKNDLEGKTEIKKKANENLEKIKLLSDDLFLRVWNKNKELKDLSRKIKYTESILIGKQSPTAKRVDIDLTYLLEDGDKCSRNQLKVFRSNGGVVLKNIGKHRVLLKNRKVEMFPGEHIYMDIEDEIVIGKNIKITLTEK